MSRSSEEAREAIRALLVRSGLSMRAMSLAIPATSRRISTRAAPPGAAWGLDTRRCRPGTGRRSPTTSRSSVHGVADRARG